MTQKEKANPFKRLKDSFTESNNSTEQTVTLTEENPSSAKKELHMSSPVSLSTSFTYTKEADNKGVLEKIKSAKVLVASSKEPKFAPVKGKILEILKEKLPQKGDFGVMVLKEFERDFKVSRSCVNAAVKEIQQEGVFNFESGGRHGTLITRVGN